MASTHILACLKLFCALLVLLLHVITSEIPVCASSSSQFCHKWRILSDPHPTLSPPDWKVPFKSVTICNSILMLGGCRKKIVYNIYTVDTSYKKNSMNLKKLFQCHLAYGRNTVCICSIFSKLQEALQRSY